MEWHGNHLPIETDFLVAQKICEIMNKRVPGYILPPIYLGSGTKKKINGKWFIGMDKYLKKKLQGNIYYLEPAFFSKILFNLCNNLINQGFVKNYIVTGHGGKGQMRALNLVSKKLKNIKVINPYDVLEKKGINVEHADENETSLFWACYPKEEAKSRKIKIKNEDDYFKYIGYDPRKKASLKQGNKILNEIINYLKSQL